MSNRVSLHRRPYTLDPRLLEYLHPRPYILYPPTSECRRSYLVDPVVRAAMQIDVTGAVLIFDEAHNIEDTARWVFSILCAIS